MVENVNGKQIRGDRLVANVLEATIAELSEVGVENVSVESVAERAQVNKTTIYRRWPTPEKLIHAAFLRIANEGIVVPDEGSLAADLSKLIGMLRVLLASPHTHALIRMHLGGTMHGELASLARKIQREKDEQMKTIILRAVDRGELPRSTDVDLLYATLVGAFFNIAVFRSEHASGARMEQAVDLILHGAKNTTGRSRTRPRPRARSRDAKRTTVVRKRGKR
jgi:AcrR family transcriptional regulator